MVVVEVEVCSGCYPCSKTIINQNYEECFENDTDVRPDIDYHLASTTTSIMEVAQPLAEHQRLIDAIKANSHLFALGSEEIQQSALAAAKATFDSGLSSIRLCFPHLKATFFHSPFARK